MFSIRKGNIRALPPFKKFLDDNTFSRRSKGPFTKKNLQGLFALTKILTNKDTLSGRKSIRLHHQGKIILLDRRQGRLIGVKNTIGRRWNTIFFQKSLGKNLRAFESSGPLCGSKDSKPLLTKGVHDPDHKRLFRTHHREIYLLIFGKLKKLMNGLSGNRNTFGNL